jgi:hypothetical protein
MTINNNNIFGAFTLNEARGSRLTGDWLNKESVANYGWFGGGGTPSSVATVDRIDFSNDSATASPRGSLSSARQGLTATGNSNYGWFGGGGFPGVSTVDRIDFSNDSATATSRGPLSLARFRLAATGNSNYGWFGGGLIPGTPTFSTVDRIDFSNDAATALARGPLSSGRYNMGATGNSNYGWFAVSPGGISTVDRIDFSNDASIASVRGPLSLSRGALTATGNSNYGWFGGGDTPSGTGPIEYTVVQRIDFSNDLSTASIRGPLTSPGRSNLAATGNSNYGWFGGGLFSTPAPPPTGASTTRVTSVDRIDFSNDSVTASPRGSLTSPARSNLAATSGVLNIRRQKAGNYGWFGGGFAPSPIGGSYSTVDRIDFSNDSTTVVRGSVVAPSVGKYNMSATGNSDYGWFGGGYTILPTVRVSSVNRIDFSNDGVTASVRGPLLTVIEMSAATGNSNYGWFGGGNSPATPSNISRVDRINFSNDLATVSSRGPLFTARLRSAATGNSNYGWFAGGYINPNTAGNRFSAVDRIDFSNDSVQASPRGVLTLQRYALAATGNSNYGWFAGGVSPSTTVSTVDRIDFSNDSVRASPRGQLNSPAGRYDLAATGNSNYGWFGGGTVPSAPVLVQTVDRIDFSNDNAIASRRGGLLSSSRSQLAATSNTPIG